MILILIVLTIGYAVAVAWIGVGVGIIAIISVILGFSTLLSIKRGNDLKQNVLQREADRMYRQKEAARVQWHKMKIQASELSQKSNFSHDINQFTYGSEQLESKPREAKANPPHHLSSKNKTFELIFPKAAVSLEANSSESDGSIESLLRNAEEAMLYIEEQRKRSHMNPDDV